MIHRRPWLTILACLCASATLSMRASTSSSTVGNRGSFFPISPSIRWYSSTSYLWSRGLGWASNTRHSKETNIPINRSDQHWMWWLTGWQRSQLFPIGLPWQSCPPDGCSPLSELEYQSWPQCQHEGCPGLGWPHLLPQGWTESCHGTCGEHPVSWPDSSCHGGESLEAQDYVAAGPSWRQQNIEMMMVHCLISPLSVVTCSTEYHKWVPSQLIEQTHEVAVLCTNHSRNCYIKAVKC